MLPTCSCLLHYPTLSHTVLSSQITHGGWKFTDYKPGVATQSEWNFVTAGVSKTDDGWAGQGLFLTRFAAEFSQIKAAGVIHVPGIGDIFVSPRACTDLAFTRSCNSRRAGSFSHCECGGGKSKTERADARRVALHDPPVVRGDETWPEIIEIIERRGCKPLTHKRLWGLVHKEMLPASPHAHAHADQPHMSALAGAS